MLCQLNRFLTYEERDAMNEDAIKRGFYRDDRRIFLPGMMWFQPFYHDPAGVDGDGNSKKYGCRVWWPSRPADVGPGTHGLSRFYWDQWADKRPPICVVCPNGEQWEIDRVSSNGEGWQVTGDLLNITCAPSIVVPGYHGFLRNGEFTADLEGRGEHGIRQYE
jgi:hypothetical protein